MQNNKTNPYQISLGFPTGSNSSISGAKIKARGEKLIYK